MMSLEQLRKKRSNWVLANQENGFEDGIKRLLTDLYPDNAHFIYELLQNAEDPCAKIVRFTLTDSSVEFEHDGERLFALKDVESITSIGASTKRDDPTSIGKFGVGFKAVFAYTNTPEIHSGDFHFRIRDLVVPETEGVLRLKLVGRETRFVFPFNNPRKTQQKAVEEVECGLRCLADNTLLFLKHIQKIEYLLPDGSLGSMERTELGDGRIMIQSIQPGGDAEISNWLRFGKTCEVIDDDGHIKICHIAIAFQLENDAGKDSSVWKITPLEHGQVSIYFPAEKETSKLRFHIHAPFASTVARDSVRDCDANRQLRDHLANLVVESLAAIRDQGMLTVAFLGVLPNLSDNLTPFYEPIRKAIVAAFKSDALVPTKSGSYAPASELFRGPARIQEVIDDEDLGRITHSETSIWAKNPPLENQREAQFLNSLELKSWGWPELARAISRPHRMPITAQQEIQNNEHKNFLNSWISEKDDTWVQRFYALLGESCDIHGYCADVSRLPLVRTSSQSDCRHVKPGSAYFPIENEACPPYADVLFVKQSVYTAGRSDSQKKYARSFLERAGVRPFDAKARIQKILQGYEKNEFVSMADHLGHIQEFVTYWLERRNETQIFIGKKILLAEQDDCPNAYFTPTDLYLDIPYLETGLSDLFLDRDLPITKPKKRLSKEYRSIKGFIDFSLSLGVMTQLEICTCKATEMQKEFFVKIGRESSSTIDEDYFINGIQWLREGSHGFLGNLTGWQSRTLSRAIWRRMSNADPKVLTAHYTPNEKRKLEAKSKSSFLVEYLASHSWVPGVDGRFYKPSEVTEETLRQDFPFDNRNGWLTAIKFAEGAKRRSEEIASRDRDAQKFGFATAEELDELAKLMKQGLKLMDIKAFLEQRTKTDLPKQSVPDPERRRKNVLANTEDAPDKESVRRERTIQKGISEVAAQARAYLRAKYKNEEGQLVCQCCHLEMPFRLGSGEHYFEAVQCVVDKESRHYQNRLALCPNCAAMYQYARETDDAEIRRRVVAHTADDKAPSVELSVRLAGKERAIRFVGTHWFDLKTLLSVG